MVKTDKMRRIELERGQSMESIIAAAGEAGWTWERLAEDLGVSRFTLRSWIGRLGGRTARTVKFSGDSVEAVR